MAVLDTLFPVNDPLTALLKTIAAVARKHRQEVYLVGGVVRDRLLGHATKDVDLTVIGDGIQFAEQMAKALRVKNIVTYPRFGTAMIPYGEVLIEVATARSEEYTTDSRKPRVFESDLYNDLARRDFTINALALSLKEENFLELTDCFGGLKDLNAGLIRTPLDPITTFSEDPLRMLRAVRFATQLDFTIEEQTFKAISAVKERIEIISQERITDELSKILRVVRNPSRGFVLLQQSGLLELILPEIAAMIGIDQRNGHHHKDVFWHTMQVLDNIAAVSSDFALRYTALMHDIAKPLTKKFIPGKGWTFHGHEELGARMVLDVSRRLRLPTKVGEYAAHLTRLHLRPIAIAAEGVTDSAVRRLIVEAGEYLDDLILLCRADITSKNIRKVQEYMANFDRVVSLIQQVREKDRLRAFQSPVRGDEIMQICQLEPGPAVGYIKKAIEEAILSGQLENTYDAAHKFLLENYQKLLAEFQARQK